VDREAIALAALMPVGVIAGFVNTLAGGGSFLTLPVLMLCGLPAPIANATNRVAVLLQAAVATTVIAKKGALDRRLFLRALIPTALGAFGGAYLASSLPEEPLRRALGALILAMAFVVARERALVERAERVQKRSRTLAIAALLFAGAYGGFIQAGVGTLLLIVLLVVVGCELAEANGVKNALVLAYTIPVLALFAIRGQIDWRAGAILAAGNAIGAWLGARMTLKRGSRAVLVLVVLIMIATGAALLLT
jgi:uncharacterized protein